MVDTLDTPQTLDTPNLYDWLAAASDADLDALPFGVVGMAQDGTVEQYNRFEANMASLIPARVIGRHFFTAVAPCTNNFMVAHRFETESEIDDIVDYVFTFKLKPIKVRLRLMKRLDGGRIYLAVAPRA